MNRSTLEWYEQMARGLVWAGAVVLLLSIVGAIIVAGSDSAIGIAPEAEEQGRGFVALASLGGGLAAAGMLAGIGAILRLLVTDRLEKLGPAPGQPSKESKPTPAREPKSAPARRRNRRDDADDDPDPEND